VSQLVPATLAITKAFNGLAQVIVQSTVKPGVITIRGKAEGLKLGASSVIAR
jgi:hypothetical protein